VIVDLGLNQAVNVVDEMCHVGRQLWPRPGRELHEFGHTLAWHEVSISRWSKFLHRCVRDWCNDRFGPPEERSRMRSLLWLKTEGTTSTSEAAPHSPLEAKGSWPLCSDRGPSIGIHWRTAPRFPAREIADSRSRSVNRNPLAHGSTFSSAGDRRFQIEERQSESTGARLHVFQRGRSQIPGPGPSIGIH